MDNASSRGFRYDARMENLPAPPPELFVQLGVLDPEKLKRCLEFQDTFGKQGLNLSLAHVVLNLGMAKPEQVARVLAHKTTTTLRCPSCSRRFTVPDFQANRRYKCEPCMAYLEIVVDESLLAPLPVPAVAQEKTPTPTGPVLPRIPRVPSPPYSPPTPNPNKRDPFD